MIEAGHAAITGSAMLASGLNFDSANVAVELLSVFLVKRMSRGIAYCCS